MRSVFGVVPVDVLLRRFSDVQSVFIDFRLFYSQGFSFGNSFVSSIACGRFTSVVSVKFMAPTSVAAWSAPG